MHRLFKPTFNMYHIGDAGIDRDFEGYVAADPDSHFDTDGAPKTMAAMVVMNRMLLRPFLLEKQEKKEVEDNPDVLTRAAAEALLDSAGKKTNESARWRFENMMELAPELKGGMPTKRAVEGAFNKIVKATKTFFDDPKNEFAVFGLQTLLSKRFLKESMSEEHGRVLLKATSIPDIKEVIGVQAFRSTAAAVACTAAVCKAKGLLPNDTK